MASLTHSLLVVHSMRMVITSCTLFRYLTFTLIGHLQLNYTSRILSHHNKCGSNYWLTWKLGCTNLNSSVPMPPRAEVIMCTISIHCPVIYTVCTLYIFRAFFTHLYTQHSAFLSSTSLGYYILINQTYILTFFVMSKAAQQLLDSRALLNEWKINFLAFP